MTAIQSEIACEYFICQYLADAFRREPRNVGVIVRRDQQVECLFAGETDSGVDGRKIGWIRDQNAYKQWVAFWKRQVERRDVNLEKRLLESGKTNYYVVSGGTLAGTSSDSLRYVCNYLFSTLVSFGGVDDLEEADEEKSSPPLERMIASAFREAKIFGSVSRSSSPVYKDKSIFGENKPHDFAFVQKSGVLRAMEVFDFNLAKSKALKYHAGWAKMAFEDVSRANQDKGLDMVSIFVPAESSIQREAQDYCLPLLEMCSNLCDWNNKSDKSALIKKCQKSAGFMLT